MGPADVLSYTEAIGVTHTTTAADQSDHRSSPLKNEPVDNPNTPKHVPAIRTNEGPAEGQLDLNLIFVWV